MHRTILLSFVCASLLACGGPPAASTEETQSTTTGEEEPAHPAWDDMDHEQRAQLMSDVVMPRMRTMFQEYDSERYSEFGCRTCHGENAREVEFHMPNGIHPLNPAEMPAMFQSEDPEVQRAAQFMSGQVMPAMIEMLGVPGYDPQTHEGFGCFGCHGTAE